MKKLSKQQIQHWLLELILEARRIMQELLITEGASLQNEFFHFRMISKDLIPFSFGQKS
ncbi:hypothetical protein CLOL250_00746 [Clostridium sp. L2-50]|nr:hypothetical protein CLOL250_00746 [Clostridium sp. L2-50]